jgi:hypothetical protein
MLILRIIIRKLAICCWDKQPHRPHVACACVLASVRIGPIFSLISQLLLSKSWGSHLRSNPCLSSALLSERGVASEGVWHGCLNNPSRGCCRWSVRQCHHLVDCRLLQPRFGYAISTHFGPRRRITLIIRGRASSGFRGHWTAAWTAARTAYMQFLDLMLARARRRAAPCICSRPCDAGRVCTTAWGRQSQPGTATVCACGPSRDYLPKGVAKATLAPRNWRGTPPADDVSRKICEISGCFFRQKEGEEFHRKPLPSILLAFIRRSSLRKSFLFLTVSLCSFGLAMVKRAMT